jgi:hypothetical protein
MRHIWSFGKLLFFIIAKNYGLWVPLGVNERTVLNSFSPAWDAVSVGIHASTLEEFGFRIFFLVVFQRLTGSFWLANLFQALAWGFGHCNYAVEPPYARGVELTIAGFFFGWIMRRYGVLSLVLGHYAFDVYLSVIPLFTSHNFADLFFAALSMAPLIVLPAFCFYLMHKRGIALDETVNNVALIVDASGAETTAITAEQQPLGVYSPLTKRRITILLEISLLAILGLLIPVRKLGEDALLLVDRSRAVAIARSYFEREKFDVHDMQATAWLVDDTKADQLQYIYSRTDFNKADSLERQIEPRLVWNVRFWKTGNPNTFALRMGPDGNPISADIGIDELTPGAKLTRLEAFAVAERYLKPIGAVSGGVFKIFDVSKTEYPNRTDYSFVAENPGGNLKKARFQISFKIRGEHISNVSRFWSLPKNTDDEDKGSTAFWVNLAILAAAILVVPNVGYWCFYIFKRQPPNKFVVAVVTLAVGIIGIIEQINRESFVAFYNYVPTEPLDTHVLQVVFGSLMQVALNMTLAAFVAAVVTASYPHIFASTNPVELFRNAKSVIGKKRVWADAVLIGYAAAIVIAAIWNFREHLLGLYSSRALVTNVKHAVWLEQSSPAMTSLLYAITRGLLASFVAAAGLRWSEFYQNGSWSANAHKGVNKASPLFTPIFIAIVICISNLSIHNPVGMFIQIVTALISALALYLVLVRIGNKNIAACFFATFFLLLGADAAYLQAHDSVIHRFDVIVLVLVLVLPISWLCAQAVVAAFSKSAKAES